MNTYRNIQKLFLVVVILALTLCACSARQASTAVAVEPVLLESSPKLPAAPAEEVKIVTAEKEIALATAPAAPPVKEAAPAVPLPFAPPAPRDNYFEGYGINSFEDTVEDHLSTFALDVDTASYTVARRYVMDGNLPPSDSVRVEEFVNYFDQDYQNPDGVAFGLYADGAPSPFHTDGSYILRFGVQGYTVSEAMRKPLALTLVIDTSGSMKMENRLELLKDSLKMLVERLRHGDSLAIVTYGSDARILLHPVGIEDTQGILNLIYSLEPGGSTNAEAGLDLGYQLAAQAYRSNYNNRVILLSDGVANTGATDPDQLIHMISEYARSGIPLTTIGVGMGNFNDILLEKLADHGNGNYAYIDDLDEARRLFVDQLTTTLETIALDAKIQVDFNPEVVARYRLIGYENRAVADQDFRNDQVDAGEINDGHSATALYAVILHPGAEGRIATVQLRWQEQKSHTVQEINGNFNTWNLAYSFDNASPRYQLAVVVTEYAEILRRSPWAANTSILHILDHAVRLAGQIPEDPAVAEFTSLVSRASQIRALLPH